jgi:hypothetical protein
MSTPAGQSLEQPLHARHGSSDSDSSGAENPPTRAPSASSCNTLALPLVESFSSFVA